MKPRRLIYGVTVRCGHFLPIASICSAIAFALISVSANAQTNLLIDLGVGTGYGINNSGQVVLASSIYANGMFTPLGMAGAAINASGQVAGSVLRPPNDTHAALYSNGTITDLGVIPGSDPRLDASYSTGINSSGEVVGWGGANHGANGHAFIYRNGTMTDIGSFPGSLLIDVQASGINDSGKVTGVALNVSGLNNSNDAFIYDNGMWTDIAPGIGYAINAGGQVTGVHGSNTPLEPLNTPPTGQAFIYTAGAVADLGTLAGGTNSVGYAINGTGQVVGSSDATGSSVMHAYFYNGIMNDLNGLINASDPLRPFVTLTDARGINDSRLIVVNGVDSRTQQTHAYLLQAPWISLSPAVLTFPTEPIGMASPTQAVSVTNAGTMPLAIDSISTTADFTQTNNCGTAVAPGGGCAVMVIFMPVTSGTRTGDLTVVSDGAPFIIALSGNSAVSASITSSASTVMTGTPITLTWTASPGSSCTANGGAAAIRGAAKDGWTGTIPPSGTKSVTESIGAKFTYGLTCTAGSQTGQSAVPVVVTWPPVRASLSASPTAINAGQSTTIMWSSTNATSCAATGGGASDGWPGTKATSGSAAVTEPFVPAAPLIVSFVLTCTSSASGQSAQATAKVTENPPPAAKSGGGGSFDWVFVIFLLATTGTTAYARQSVNRTATQ
jgi:probable HAF family extracellular repeat protein